MRSKTVKAVDLFCGAGGTSTGLAQACAELDLTLRLVAVNHWDVAISTHSKNHADAEHLCANLDNINPRTVVPGGRLNLLVASPECTHHSVARGGKPINDQSRASAWRVVEWASQIQIDRILIENVKEFRTWGPLGANGRPLKSRKGETYFAFLNALRALGYIVEEKVLNAADFGDPTSRERLFIQARRGIKPISWPEPTHASAVKSKPTANGGAYLFDVARKLKPHRPARDIIDWTIPGESIFTRKKPLSENTMARIFAGLQKYCGLPFVIGAGGPCGSGQPFPLDRPLKTVLAENHSALVQPFLVKFYGGQHSAPLDKPIPALTANYEHYGLAQPFIVVLRNNADAESLDKPLKTLTTGGNFGLCEPFIVQMRNGQTAQSIESPLSTITTLGAHHGLCQPFLIRYNGNHEGRKDGDHRNASVEQPMPTLDTSNRLGLVQPFIITLNHGKDDTRSHDIERPMPTVTSVDAWGVIHPFLVKYNGTGGPMSVDGPLDTVTAKDRFGLVETVLDGSEAMFALDIRFRMLQPHELAAAMSFPRTYSFAGNREQKVKQIGNAVPVNLAKALCKAILGGR